MPFRIALLVLAADTSAAAQTPADTLDFSEPTPEMIGGLAEMQARIVYADAERKAGRQGTVIARFVVTTAGKTAAVTVARSVSAGLDAAAVTAVRARRPRRPLPAGRAWRGTCRVRQHRPHPVLGPVAKTA